MHNHRTVKSKLLLLMTGSNLPDELLPPNVNEYIEFLQKSTDAISLKRHLTQELECPASD
jgi:hypothetical protein